jgi:hypothetical protein
MDEWATEWIVPLLSPSPSTSPAGVNPLGQGQAAIKQSGPARDRLCMNPLEIVQTWAHSTEWSASTAPWDSLPQDVMRIIFTKLRLQGQVARSFLPR